MGTEYCLGIIHAPLTEAHARSAVRRTLPTVTGIWPMATSKSSRPLTGISRT